MPIDNPHALAEQAVDVLARHPWIGTARTDGGGAVRVAPAESALRVGTEPGALITEYLDHWGELYDFTYTRAEDRHADDLDLSGWRASDTGKPLPAEHMREWAERTVDLVLESRPELVLELGCGTGLLMHRLRDRVRYVGCDVAAAVVRALHAEAHPGTSFALAAAHETGAAQVRGALDYVGGLGARPDCVLINSVTQCFPNLDYLRAVLLDAIALVRPGGTVVVGDVRHAGLLDAYCRWVEETADPGADPSVIADRAGALAARDDELLFDPPALASIAAEAPREVRVSVRAKTMTADTELTRYRFDAVLAVDSHGAAVDPPTQDWSRFAAGPSPGAGIADRLGGAPGRVAGIPNAAVADAEGAVAASALHEAVSGIDACVEIDPFDPGLLAVCAPRSASARPAAELARPGRAHEPFRAFIGRRLAEAARAHLRRNLPDARGLRVAVDADAASGTAS